MKIAFITLGFKPLRLSGLDVSGERLVERLLGAGHHITVISGRIDRAAEVLHHDALTIRRIPLGRSDWIGFSLQAARAIDQLGPFDVVHFWDVHFGYAYRRPFVASIQHSFNQRLASISFRRDGLRYPKGWIYYQAARRFAEIPAARRSQGLLAGSAATRDEFISRYGIPAEKIALARHGIDLDRFHPGLDTQDLRLRLNLPQARPILLFLGFITPRKGIEYLLRALPRIRPEPVLILAGRWRDERYRQKVFASNVNLHDIVVEAGFLEDGLMPALYNLADVYVSASLMEGFGLPLAEALACETPVVAAQAGATGEVVGPGGVLVPPEDSTALAEAVSRLLEDPDQRRRMGAAGREWVASEFSLERMTSEALRAYETFLG